MSNVLKNYKILLDKDYVLSLLDEYLKSDLTDEDIFTCDKADTTESNLANAKFFTSLVAKDFNGEDKRVLASGLISDPERITYKSWDILGTEEDENLKYFFNICVSNKEKETLLYAIYSVCKKRGIPFQISNLKPSFMSKGRKDVIQVSTSLENFDNIYNALLSVSNLYTKKCSTPSLLTQPVSEWLAFDALTEDGRKVSDIIRSTFLDCVHIYGDDKQVISSTLEDETIRGEFVNAVLTNLQNSLANISTITFKQEEVKEYEVTVDPVNVKREETKDESTKFGLTQEMQSLTNEVLSMLKELDDTTVERTNVVDEDKPLEAEEVPQIADVNVEPITEEPEIFGEAEETGSYDDPLELEPIEKVNAETPVEEPDMIDENAAVAGAIETPVEETEINFHAPTLDLLSSANIKDAIDFGSTSIIPVSEVQDVLEAETVEEAQEAISSTVEEVSEVQEESQEDISEVEEKVEETPQEETVPMDVEYTTENDLNNLLYAGMEKEETPVEETKEEDNDWLNSAFNLDPAEEVHADVTTEPEEAQPETSEYVENKTEILELDGVMTELSETQAETVESNDAPAEDTPAEETESPVLSDIDPNNVFGIEEPEAIAEEGYVATEVSESEEVQYNFEPQPEPTGEPEVVNNLFDNGSIENPQATTVENEETNSVVNFVEVQTPTIPDDFAGMEVTDLTDQQREILVDTAEAAQNVQINELMSKYSEVSTDPSFYGLQISLPNGESMTVLDYFETNNILSKIPLNANVYTAEGVILKGSQFIYKIVTDGLVSQYDSLDTIIDTFSSKISMDEPKKKSRGLFGLFGKAA